ncbi:permease prefix domain 1-containing protein [Aquihabitans sp. McL0605]|uniref:permease prefix domain 1-containing protein n=1 Tax=Aquihabitans sp. McL0605 TaxID=3415671 RepID=UPI003CF4AF2C
MAEHHTGDHRLIEEYLSGLRPALDRQPDADGVIVELRDHLLATAERHERSGATPIEAERRALAEVGDADVVADAFARNAHGGAAVATAFTRAAGVAGFIAAGAGAIAVASFAIGDRIEEQDGFWSPASQAWGSVGAVGTFIATLSALVLLIGVIRRHGGIGWAGPMAIGLAGSGAFVSIAAWAVPVWAGLVGASWLVLAVATHRSGSTPWAGAPLLATGALALSVAAATHPTWTTGATVLDSAAIVAAGAGAVVLGRALVAEQPAAAGPVAIAA